MLSFDDNPPIRSPLLKLEEGVSHTWCIAHTLSRSEKAFAWDLFKRKVPYFLPMVERVTFSGGRKRRGLLPLFSSYVFVDGREESYHRALTTNRLCQLIKVVDNHSLTQDLLTIDRALKNNLVLDPYPHAVVGRRCRITAGPLRGTEGVVVQRSQGAFKLVLEVRMLGQGASVEIEVDLLEPVDSLVPATRATV
ncbi:MAG: UpxY family transcription antiterminator [Burkholderiales bacterium]|nr:UpxY family transcription antiterminator [Phycisphaerae bacterium]